MEERTNVLGEDVMSASVANNVEKVIVLSTDKRLSNQRDGPHKSIDGKGSGR